MQATQPVCFVGFACAFGLCLSLFFAWLFICSWHALLGLPSQPRPDQTGPGQASAALFLLPARLKLITGHKSWPAYQRQRQQQQSSRAGRIPNWQRATGCHAMTITSCSSYSPSSSSLSSSSRLLIRATCHACQRGQGCVLLPRIVAAARAASSH